MQPGFRAIELKGEKSMKKLATLLTVIAAFTTLASASHATCVASGEISRVSVNPGSVVSSFYVITSTPEQPSYVYGTTDGKVVNAVLTAQASHMTATATGSAASCPSPIGGVINGGTVISFTTAP
jgi:hypothetical protein